MMYLTNEQIALLVSQAIEKIDQHDEADGCTPILDEARALLQQVCNGIDLTPKE